MRDRAREREEEEQEKLSLEHYVRYSVVYLCIIIVGAFLFINTTILFLERARERESERAG